MRLANRLDSEELNRGQLLAVGLSGGAVILLQIVNAISIHAFWPFAIALTYHTALALFNFVGLLLSAISDERAA